MQRFDKKKYLLNGNKIILSNPAKTFGNVFSGTSRMTEVYKKNINISKMYLCI